MLQTLRFSLQNAVYFIMLPFLVPVLFTFYIQYVLCNVNVKLQCQKVNVAIRNPEYVAPMYDTKFISCSHVSYISLASCQ